MIENNQRKINRLILMGDLIIASGKKEKITKYASISLGGTPSRKHPEYWNGTIKWINSGAITGTPAILNESEYITELGIKHSATKPAKRGDSVLSIIEPSKNKVAVILDNNIYFNQSVICISSIEKINTGLIYFASRNLINEIKGYATGAAQQSLNKDMIEKSDILIPSKDSIIKLNYLLNSIIYYEESIRNLSKIKNALLEKYF